MEPSVGVAEYYANKTIFITGATGFMGKVLVEKLLRCCPGIKRIYLLMRSKKGLSITERLEDFLKSQVFSNLHENNPKCFEKLRLVPGDILVENLGISEEDREELRRECQIIFHCAACVRFDMKLKDAANLNIWGTLRVLELVEGMRNIEVYIQVSTAYCRCELPVLEERVYETEHNPQKLLQCVDWMDDELLTHLEPKLIAPQPNTYAYTKSLSEALVAQYEGRFPIAIVRPSIVTAALKEPMPGWVDNLNGPTGLLVGAGKGVIRTMHLKESLKADVVPVDLVVNGCILVAYNTGRTRLGQVAVVNLTESGRNPLTWGAALDMWLVHLQEFPFSVCLWYPGGSPKSSRLLHELAVLFTHLLPAYLLDLLLLLLGKKTFMVRKQKRISYGLEVLQYYTTKEWHFKNDNFVALRKSLSQMDDDTFYTDIKMVNWSSYLRDYVRGAREYCCKEDPATLPRARRQQTQLYYLDLVTKLVFYLLCAYFLYYYTKVTLSLVF
ncbi:putative fatty acyl-CoA reductase CG5065 isoform X1 [Choristoneura fumiferana]|uniref:putative fatty acyl-CoA reductase CG5065 isoform X1 n=1 Tax=Choristoneura fumiferana TaxID=7141 RepID=UPI003D15D743